MITSTGSVGINATVDHWKTHSNIRNNP